MTSATTEKIYALDLSIEEWAGLLTEMDDKPFRAVQIAQWLWQKHVYDADGMTNLSKSLRDELKERVDFRLPELVKEQRSQDGTRKYLWRLRDGQTVESVLMKHNDRLTACVSTQVGCPLQCVFCATGLSGYVRNLSAGEIAAQFLAMEKAAGRDINNVVYMGMGEPFLNTANVLKSVRLLSDEKMRNLGIRHFTISTSGVLPGIIQLANSGLGVRLAVSLHAADDELRGQLMPINQKYPAAELRKTMEEYQRITGDRITIEYVLFGGTNDGVDDARALVRYLKGLHTFINLIPFNAVDGRFEKPSAEAVLKFRKILETAGFDVELRREYGADIEAACGQLRRKTETGEPCRLDPKPGYKLASAKPEAERVKTPRPKKEAEPAQAGKHPAKADKQEKTRREPKKREESSREERGERKPAQGTGKSDKTKREPARQAEGRREERGERRQRPARDGKRPAETGKYGAGGDKRRKTDEPPKERYRSGKKKEERPSHKGRSEEKEARRGAKWYDGAAQPRRPKSKKAAAPGAKKTSMTGAEKKTKPAPKTRAKKKK